MGCGSSSPDGSSEKKRTSKQIDAELKLQAKKEDSKIKLLLLGAGESGKSTIFKQMKIIYGAKFTEKEKKQQLPTIHCNILQGIKILIDQIILFELADKIESPEAFNMLNAIDENEAINVEIGDSIKKIWMDPICQSVWDRRSEYQIIDSVEYYFKKIDQIKMPDYVPDKDDIIQSRVRTSGIVTERYIIDNTVFEMYDVGGQRNERKKWIHCFEGVTAVIFVAAVSEYDQKLFEDSSTNRMVEALDLFEEICNNTFFLDSSMILFLNKKDLFAEKILHKNIRDSASFSDFSGRDCSYEDGVQFFLDKFMSRNKNSERQIYHHVTCATDTENVKVVFDACKDIVLRQNIKNSPFNME